MNLMELLQTRRSVRRFRPEPVPRATVLEVLEAAVLAPSASNKQPWRFLVIQTRATISAMASAVRAAKERIEKGIPAESGEAFSAYGDYFTRFESAPLVIVPLHRALYVLSQIVDQDLPERATIAAMEEQSGLIGTSLALGNLLLRAHELGLGASVMTGPLIAEPALRAQLEVPEGWGIVALVPLGFPDETPMPTTRKDVERVVRWV
jgi:nitroreductase